MRTTRATFLTGIVDMARAAPHRACCTALESIVCGRKTICGRYESVCVVSDFQFFKAPPADFELLNFIETHLWKHRHRQ